MEDMDCNRQANSPEGEPLSSHRRGHWFEPITTHHSNSPPVLMKAIVWDYLDTPNDVTLFREGSKAEDTQGLIW